VTLDPVETNPDHYSVVYENDRVRVLEYNDRPGDRTTVHDHPDSVMYALSSFHRRLHTGAMQRDVEITEGTTVWVPAQQHFGENIGSTPSHSIFVELKDAAVDLPDDVYLGPE